MSSNPLDPPLPAQGLSAEWLLFSFEGRIPRRVFWACSVPLELGMYLLVLGLGEVLPPDSPELLLASAAVYLLMAWPLLALQAKRWHDRGYSGWMSLVRLIPLAGPLWSFVELCCLRGTHGENVYGADPT